MNGQRRRLLATLGLAGVAPLLAARAARAAAGSRVALVIGNADYKVGALKNPVNDALVAMHYKEFKSPPDFFTAGGFSAAMAVVEALKKTKADTNSDKLITAMEGMTFDTPKGPMTFRKEDHQAMQSMYHFRVAPGAKQGTMADLHLVKEIKPAEMNVPIRNKR